jgi:hypothetical protein
MLLPVALSAEKWIAESIIAASVIYTSYVLIFFPLYRANVRAQTYILSDDKIEFTE